MKATESKPSSTTAKAGTPFFSKEGGQASSGSAFFDSGGAENSFFGGSHGTAIQTKLTVGQPNDPYEKEADATADKVVNRLANPSSPSANGSLVQASPLASTISRFVQTKCAACEHEEKLQKADAAEDIQTKPIFESEEGTIQRKCASCEKEEQLQKKSEPGTAAEPSSDVESYLSSSKGQGSVLPAPVRSDMESAMGADFGNVRIHNDSSSYKASNQLQAQAFTHGSDIYFNQGKFDTGNADGKHLLAHELTHVIQQGSAGVENRVSKTNTAGHGGNSSPSTDTTPNNADPAPTNSDQAPANSDQAPSNADPATMNTELQSDIDADDLGGIKVPDENKDDEDADLGGGGNESNGGGEGDTSEAPDAETGPQDKGLKEDKGAGQAGANEGGPNVTIPENTPTTAKSEGTCPTIAPEFPQPPANATLEEDKDSFFTELMSFVSGDIPRGLTAIPLALGQGAYLIWRTLPLWIKVKAVNFALDKIITGAYWGRVLGPYVGFGTGLISAALTGFFKRIRQMQDEQKVRMFEKFGKMVLGGDVSFTLGLFKGLLIGFFLDGLLGIIQMIIDLFCMVPKIINFFRTIGDFIDKVPQEVQLILANIQEFFSSLGDSIKNAFDELIHLIKNPEKLADLIETIYQSAATQAEKLGDSMADTMIRYAALPAEALGTIAGRIGGRLLFEGVLTYVTGGGEAAVNAVKIALREIGQVLSKIGKAIFEIIKRLGEIFTFVKNIIAKIIKFLTPLLKALARLARRIIDKIKALFNLFRRMCKPGSIICKVLKPNCRANHVARLGGSPVHDRYVTRTTGQTQDYRVRGPFFGVNVPCNYDARLGPLRVLVEGKTGYRYLPFIEHTNPGLFRFIMFRLNEQRFRCSAIAARCGYAYVWYMQDPNAARFLAFRWHGIPPVLHMP